MNTINYLLYTCYQVCYYLKMIALVKKPTIQEKLFNFYQSIINFSYNNINIS